MKYNWHDHLTLVQGKKVKINIKDITYVRKSDEFSLWKIITDKDTIFVKEKYAKKLIGYKHFDVMINAFEKLKR